MPSAAEIARAVARLPTQSNAEIKRVLENARRLGATDLVDACRRELTLRGSGDVTAEEAVAAWEASALVGDKDLRETVEIAFARIPPYPHEPSLISLIANNPDVFSAQLHEKYGGGFNLEVGHLVYSRFGFFRKYLETEQDQSSILIAKSIVSGRVFYNGFKPEVLAAFRSLKII